MSKVNERVIVLCPTCQKEVVWSSQQRFKPFCCERCKLIDLGEWANGDRKIPGDSTVLDPDH